MNYLERMDRKRYVIVMAAGSGTRMGADKPKQFVEIEGKAILQKTMEKFIIFQRYYQESKLHTEPYFGQSL